MTRQVWRRDTWRGLISIRSSPGGSGGIRVGPNGGKIGDIARRHSCERRLTAKVSVGLLHPAIGVLGLRIDDLQDLPDARPRTRCGSSDTRATFPRLQS